MSFPSKNDILIGLAFVFFGILFALCDRWQMAVKFKGNGSPHPFDHLTVMWILKQLVQMSLFFIWMAIDKNWLGFGRFRHGDIVHKANLHGRILPIPRLNEEPLSINADDEADGGGNGHIADDTGAEIHDRRYNHGEHDTDNEENAEETDAEDKELIVLAEEKKHRKGQKSKKPSVLIYLAPAVFALADVLLMYFGLSLTYGSSFIMLKGTVTFFTALLSMSFLAQQLACYVWFGVVVSALGFAVTGISDYIKTPSGGYEKYGIAAGNLLIVMAQIMFATKIIYEEKFIRKHSIHPMKFLGCEAFYGIGMAAIFLVAFSFVDGSQYNNLPNQKLEDIGDAIFQFCHNWRVILAVLGSLFCYIMYTYLGLFLIRDHGALPRIMIETFIWSIYWAVCLALGWDQFFIAQVPGLCVIIIGVLLYSHILVLPFTSRLEGIDKTVDNFRDQFMNFNKAGNQQSFHQNILGGDDENMLQTERDNDCGQNNAQLRERDNEYGQQRAGNHYDPQEVVVEVHHRNGEERQTGDNRSSNDALPVVT
ncbi:unnamed protein product [Candidula unifasciata]|uniref:Uncharacterized protein n=1 Tax=Candidula unifasciata TaxID=100452 RepID=A0A8S3YT89_9EUPU|nr:unnamed protein product [Candidula unifasciata]